MSNGGKSPNEEEKLTFKENSIAEHITLRVRVYLVS